MVDKEIFELINRFENSGLTELSLEDEGRKIHMKKEWQQSYAAIPVQSAEAAAPKPPAGLSAAPAAATSSAEPAAPAASAAQENIELIRSPIVGIFYKAPSPDEPEFAAIGDRISKGQTLCIIEAMKVTNELKSPCDGILRAVNGINGQLAEYDQVLFEVEKC